MARATDWPAASRSSASQKHTERPPPVAWPLACSSPRAGAVNTTLMSVAPSARAVSCRRVRAALTSERVRFHTYPDAEHAFDNPHPMFFHAEASALAWTRTLTFLAEQLGES